MSSDEDKVREEGRRLAGLLNEGSDLPEEFGSSKGDAQFAREWNRPPLVRSGPWALAPVPEERPDCPLSLQCPACGDPDAPAGSFIAPRGNPTLLLTPVPTYFQKFEEDESENEPLPSIYIGRCSRCEQLFIG